MCALEIAAPEVVAAPRRAWRGSSRRSSAHDGWRAFVYGVAGIVAIWATCIGLRSQGLLVRTGPTIAAIVLLSAAAVKTSRVVVGNRMSPATALSSLWLGLLLLTIAFADLLPLAEHRNQKKTLLEPGFATPDLFSKHPFGTNSFALDLLARSIYGARVSLLTAGLAVCISIVVGGIIGVLAGYERRRFDVLVSIVTDSLLAFPAILLLIAVAAVAGRPESVTQAVLKNGFALSLVGVPTIVRLARAHTIRFVQRDFVYASRVMGAKPSRIIRRDIVPNVVPPLFSFAFVILALLIVADGSLSFLGLGLGQPEPTWGNMIAEAGLSQLRDHPFIVMVPGAFMFLTVLSLNQIGETLQARWSTPVHKRRRAKSARSTTRRPSVSKSTAEKPEVVSR